METLDIDLSDIEILEYNTIIIGSGAAGLNCALHLIGEGIAPWEIAIVTEKLGGGTSFNAGSDKQTYYKLSLIGDQLDSPVEMAKDLFSGGSMHGDIALVEANNSINEFFHLIQLGVPFPHDIYGAYAGYKTDNDPKQRATSIGPYTSQVMCKCLLDVVKELKIKIFDKFYAVKILTEIDDTGENQNAIGVICLDTNMASTLKDLNDIIKNVKIFKTRNVVMATGGPSTLYKNSVYPTSQNGTTSLAIEAGCTFQNLTESQFGLASTQYRWNVSGSYQQVIPRYYSKDNNGKSYDFLNDYFHSFKDLSKATFLKGYQWPFSSERIEDQGSSLIDLAVYYETEILKRTVFLDFRNNPKGYEFEKLDSLPKEYLKKSNSMGKTPLMRLLSLNEQAYQHYKDNGIDLSKEPLQIAVCNQHLNGGVSCDIWWESNVKHLFAIGEINGSHGIHRPGGAALNSGQVGGLRAAQKIGNRYYQPLDLNNENFFRLIEEQLIQFLYSLNTCINLTKQKEANEITKIYSLSEFTEVIQERMEKFAGILRPID
ncbi:MAG: FAD-binding protein, partial [Promethearchaeota archaeon]